MWQGCEVSIKELDTLLLLLTEKKRKMEQEEAERNMQILMTFLHCLRKQKVDELNEVCCLQFGPSCYSLVMLIWVFATCFPSFFGVFVNMYYVWGPIALLAIKGGIFPHKLMVTYWCLLEISGGLIKLGALTPAYVFFYFRLTSFWSIFTETIIDI